MTGRLAFDAGALPWLPESRGAVGVVDEAIQHACAPLAGGDEAEDTAPGDWRDWLADLFPAHVRAPFAARHERFWNWLWPITPESDPDPFVGIWPRGGGKSSTAELGVAALGLRGRRAYVLYVRDTQDRADDSVRNVGALLESSAVAVRYPRHARRLVGKYGNSQGWRRNRLRTAGGFTVDALGLDVAGRGVKLEEQRPDVIVFDDVDGRHDSTAVTAKKLSTITDSLLPAGTANCAVVAIQNLVIPHGIFARLADGRADFLARRIVSGPEPALTGMRTRNDWDAERGRMRSAIISGEPTWAGQGRRACQQLMDLIGLPSFKRECQHEVHEREGALWTAAIVNAHRVAKAPPLKRIVVGVDPSGGGTEIGIVAAGLGYDGRVYVLEDRTQPGRLGPNNWGRVAVALYHDLEADRIVAEANFGGDMVESTIRVADPAVPVKLVHASRGKAVRAEPVAALYGDPEHPDEPGSVYHVGTFPELEAEQTGWAPGDKESPNRLDAEVWAVTDLKLGPAPARATTTPARSRTQATF